MKAGLTPMRRAALVELHADALARRGKCYLPTVGTFYLGVIERWWGIRR